MRYRFFLVILLILIIGSTFIYVDCNLESEEMKEDAMLI